MTIFNDSNITSATVFDSTFDENLSLNDTTLQELNSQHAFAFAFDDDFIFSISIMQDNYFNDILMSDVLIDLKVFSVDRETSVDLETLIDFEALIDLEAFIDVEALIDLKTFDALETHNHFNTLLSSWFSSNLIEFETMQLKDDSFTTFDTTSQSSIDYAREIDRSQRRREITSKSELRLNLNVKIIEIKINQQHNLKIRLIVELMTASQKASERFESDDNIAWWKNYHESIRRRFSWISNFN